MRLVQTEKLPSERQVMIELGDRNVTYQWEGMVPAEIDLEVGAEKMFQINDWADSLKIYVRGVGTLPVIYRVRMYGR